MIELYLNTLPTLSAFTRLSLPEVKIHGPLPAISAPNSLPIRWQNGSQTSRVSETREVSQRPPEKEWASRAVQQDFGQQKPEVGRRPQE